MIHIQTFPVNWLEMNCYVVFDETKQAVIIDCGAISIEEKQQIASFIEKEALKPVVYLLTHAHFDHCLGSEFIEKEYGLLPRMHEADRALYDDLDGQLQMFLRQRYKGALPPAGRYVDKESIVSFGNHHFSIIETPGHTPGGVCYYCEEEKVLFTGDSLFCGSVGRTDFHGSDANSLITSVKDMVHQLPEEVTVMPGHGPSTTIGYERATNPFL